MPEPGPVAFATTAVAAGGVWRLAAVAEESTNASFVG